MKKKNDREGVGGGGLAEVWFKEEISFIPPIIHHSSQEQRACKNEEKERKSVKGAWVGASLGSLGEVHPPTSGNDISRTYTIIQRLARLLQ